MDKLNFDKIKNAVDDIKNKVLAENDSERRVCEALSNKNWGASSTLMNDIARDTYDYQLYGSIMTILWGAFDAPKREWRKVFKALGLLEHLIKHGTELVVEDSRDRLHRLRMLTSFSYTEKDVDKGSGIREKSKQLMELLRDNDAIREERNKARKLRNKFVGVGSGGGGYSDYAGGGGGSSSTYNDSYYRGGGGGGYQDRGSNYPDRFSQPRRDRVSSSTTDRYRDNSPARTGYSDRYDNEIDDDRKRPTTQRSSKQNVKNHSSKSVEDTYNTNKSVNTRSRSADTTLPPSSGGEEKGEDLLGAENDFADFRSAPPVPAVNMVGAAPEEDEWEAFKSSSPTTSVPVEVDAVKTQQQQPLSDMFHGGNSSTLPEPQALLAELPPPQQQILSQHNEENPFDLLAMGEQPQVPHQQQQQVVFGSTGLDTAKPTSVTVSVNSPADNNQEWGDFFGHSGGSCTGAGIGDFQSAPSGGGTTAGSTSMLNVEKSGMNNNTGSNDLSNLVNLGGLQTNDLQRENSLIGKRESLDLGRSSSSFRGLDGFTTAPQGSVSSHGGGPNMNNGVGELSSSQPGSFFMKLAPSPGYSIQQPQQPQQSDILGGMMSSDFRRSTTGFPQQQQQQVSQSGQWPTMVQSQPGMMGNGMSPFNALHQQKNQTGGGSQILGGSSSMSTPMGGMMGSGTAKE